MGGQEAGIRRGRDSSLRDDFGSGELRYGAGNFVSETFRVGKLYRRDPRRGVFNIRRQSSGKVKENVLQNFFLRTASHFDDERESSREALALRHSNPDAGFFCRRVELNDDRLLFLIVDQ